jgi:hypothetical protein
VAQACNPSYLGGRDWEDNSLRPAWAKSLQDPISTNSWTPWLTPVILSYKGKHKWED